MASIVQCVKQNVAPTEDLAKLVTNPMFAALQATLAKDCLKEAVPYTLCDSAKTRRHDNTDPLMDPSLVAVQEANLQSEFQQISTVANSKVQELQHFYNVQCAEIETQRSDAIEKIKALNIPNNSQYQQEVSSVHLFYDRQRMHLTNRVTASLQLLKLTVPERTVVPERSIQNRAKSRQLNCRAVALMTAWFEKHQENPYPSDEVKEKLAEEGRISLGQVKAWFANKRNRTHNTKPKKQRNNVEKKLLTICTDLSDDGGKTPRLYGDIIRQLSDIVNGSSIFNPAHIYPSPDSTISSLSPTSSEDSLSN